VIGFLSHNKLRTIQNNSLRCAPPDTPPNEFLVQGIFAMTNVTIPQEIWDHQVTANAPQSIDWLWHGFVARGNLTLLTSQWIAGKNNLAVFPVVSAKNRQTACRVGRQTRQVRNSVGRCFRVKRLSQFLVCFYEITRQIGCKVAKCETLGFLTLEQRVGRNSLS
jgi:hypothetical protein